MKKFDEMNFNEREEIVDLFSNWLKDYTHEEIVLVMAKRDEIIENEFAMNLLKELKEREEKEIDDFKHSIGNLFRYYEILNEYNPHSHPLSHSQSYRDVLYDMYIKG